MACPAQHEPAARREDSAIASPERPRASFGQVTDNSAKYGRANRVQRALLERFQARLLAQLEPLRPARILDAGCGEGHVTAWLAEALPASEITGVDGRADAVAAFRERNRGLRVVEGDVRDLPFADGTFDLVLCTEVLEHLDEPPAVVAELSRVCDGHVFLTVPHEPFFRMGNLAAGRYASRLGSTPGHIWTWGRRGFMRMVAEEAEPLAWVSLFPWQGVMARPRSRHDG